MSVTPPKGFTLLDSNEPKQPLSIPENYTAINTQTERDPNFLERTGELLSRRIEGVERGVDMFEQGEITYPELAARGLVTGFGALYDVVGETAMTLLSTMTPDRVEDFVKEQIAVGGTALMDTKAAEEFLEFYSGLSEREKFNLGTSIDGIAALLPASKVGRGITASGINAERRELAGKVLDQSERAKQQRIKEEAQGYPENLKVQTRQEQDIINTVLSVKGVKASSSPSSILNNVTKETTRIHEMLQKELAKSDVILPKGVVAKQRADALNAFFQQYPEYATKQFKDVRQKVFNAYTIGMKEFDGSPASLLRARQRMDKALKNMLKEKQLFESEGAVRDIVSVYRKSLNDIVANSVPNLKVAPALNRQFNLILAADNLASSVNKQSSVGQAALQQAKAHPFLTLGTVTGTGMTANLMNNEAVGAGLLGLGALYGVTRPPVRKAVGGAMQNLPVSRGTAYGVMESQQGLFNQGEDQ